MNLFETPRTTLRRFTLGDVGLMRELESDPDVMKFTPARVPQTLAQTEKRLKSLVEKENLNNHLGVWAAELKDPKKFVGWFMLVKTESELPELGFMLVKRHWGKGLAPEVGKLLVRFGLETLQYPGIQAITDFGNVASIRVLEKLGFKDAKKLTKFDKVWGREIECRVFELKSGPR